MSQVTYVRLPEQQSKKLDELVAKKLYSSKSKIIQEAVSIWLYERGYLKTEVSC